MYKDPKGKPFKKHMMYGYYAASMSSMNLRRIFKNMRFKQTNESNITAIEIHLKIIIIVDV